MAFVAIAYLVVWIAFNLLGFVKFGGPTRQLAYSGAVIAVAIGVTAGVLRSVETGGWFFGIGVLAALVRMRWAWHRSRAAGAGG
ncbi:hypothetical protein [Streptomyces sp. NPDC020141]|uniref:hypothetical protein n=1 Tax=Streptomyces sp. NPDC020141 TaxID=3365065 RepID=UPI0037B100D8